MLAFIIFTLLVASDLQMMSAFTITSPCAIQRIIQSDRHHGMNRIIIPQELHAREDNEDEDRDFVYARSRSGRRDMAEGSYSDDYRQGSSKGRYQDNVEFFDLDDDDDDDDLFDDDELDSDIYEETYNGIIPNPLLDAMGKFVVCFVLLHIICIMTYLISYASQIILDPDGVYERLGPELFKDWTFFRDLALFAVFLAVFSGDTHRFGTFDSVIEGLERLPPDFIK